MHALQENDEESPSGVYELTRVSSTTSLTDGGNNMAVELESLIEGYSKESQEYREREETAGGVVRDDIDFISPHEVLWRVNKWTCYTIVVSMAFSISATISLALIVHDVSGVMYLSLPLSIFMVVDTFVSTLLIFTLLCFVKVKIQRAVAAFHVFVLLNSFVICILCIVKASKLRHIFLIEPDGRHVPGTDSLRGKTAVFTRLVYMAALSSIMGASVSAMLFCRPEEYVQRYSSMPMKYTSYSRYKRMLGKLFGRKMCIISCVAALTVSMFFFGLCMWSFLSNIVINYSATTVYENYDPLVDAACVLPWPNDFFTEPCATSETGLKLSVQPRNLPVTRGGVHIDATSLNKLDGFSTSAPILFQVEEMSMHGFPNPLTIENSVKQNAYSASWLLDSSTGEPIPHFVQLDVSEPGVPLAVLQPAVPLAHGTRYVVGISGARHVVSGNILPPTPGFSALLNDSYDPETENSRAKRFKVEVFPLLKKVGVSPSSLQLAFDFTTISATKQLGFFKKMKSHAMAEHSSPIFRVLNSDVDTNGFLTIWGTISVPAYVDYRTREGLLSPCGQHLNEGHPGLECESIEEGVLLRIPPSVISGTVPLKTLVQYGHGLFSSRTEILYNGSKFLDDMSNDNGWILAATDWKGMSATDFPNIIRLLLAHNIVSSFANMINNLGQAFVVGELLMSHLKENWMLYTGSQARLIDGQKYPVSCFYGISEGGILGAAYTSFSSRLSRSVLSVSGSPFALLIPRSKDWSTYLKILRLNLSNAISIQLLLVLWQSHWDTADAGGWLAPTTIDEEENYATRVLVQEGLGDAEVSNLGSMVLARGFNSVTVAPLRNQSIFGIPAAKVESNSFDEYCSGNIFQVYNYCCIPWPTGKNASIIQVVEINDVHTRVREDPNAQKDVIDFISNGCIERNDSEA